MVAAWCFACSLCPVMQEHRASTALVLCCRHLQACWECASMFHHVLSNIAAVAPPATHEPGRLALPSTLQACWRWCARGRTSMCSPSPAWCPLQPVSVQAAFASCLLLLLHGAWWALPPVCSALHLLLLPLAACAAAATTAAAAAAATAAATAAQLLLRLRPAAVASWMVCY